MLPGGVGERHDSKGVALDVAQGPRRGLGYNCSPMLEAQKLAARRGFSRLFDGLSFRVGAGEALVVTGANGTGKTTLLRMLAGLTAPEAGEIRWQGKRVDTFAPELRAAAAFSGHLPALKDGLTAQENLASLVALEGSPASREAIVEALDDVALSRQRTLPARVLSQGQRRRIGLARLSLVARPLWVLDEPLAALDAAGSALLAKLLGRHLANGGLAVVATHAPLGLPEARTTSLVLD